MAPLFWAATILFFSSIPSSELPDFSFWKLFSFDKIVHTVMYALLAFLVMKASLRQYSNWFIRYNAVKVTAVSVTLYGGAVELFQEFLLTDRTGEWLDFVANTAGAFLGIWIFRLIFFEYIR